MSVADGVADVSVVNIVVDVVVNIFTAVVNVCTVVFSVLITAKYYLTFNNIVC